MASFKPPTASAAQCSGVPFNQAEAVAVENKTAFDEFDQTDAGQNDPNKCKALLRFPDNQVFWSSKMAVDADGPAAGPDRPDGKGDLTLDNLNAKVEALAGELFQKLRGA